MSEIRLPLGLSVAGHAACLALLVLLLGETPPVPEPIATGGIEVVFAPLPKSEEPQPPTQAEIPPPVETPPPELELAPPPPEEPVIAPQPPPPRPVHRLEKAPTSPTAAPPQSAAAAVGAPQAAYAPTPVPAPVPSAEVSPGYRALLSAWLETHKRYPDSARQRGEEGRAVLRFAVDRSGRILDFAVAHSSGFPNLDSSIEEMMRGAILPPFPASMTQSRIDVSVTIRFSLAR